MMGGWTMGWMWIWPVFTLAAVLLIGYAVMQVLRGGQPPAAGGAADSSAARRILDERFARGEIEEEDYSRRRSLLG